MTDGGDPAPIRAEMEAGHGRLLYLPWLRMAENVVVGDTASLPVLEAHRAFQAEITYMNAGRSETEHDKLLDAMFRAMRKDVQPRSGQDNPRFAFTLLGIPPEVRND